MPGRLAAIRAWFAPVRATPEPEPPRCPTPEHIPPRPPRLYIVQTRQEGAPRSILDRLPRDRVDS